MSPFIRKVLPEPKPVGFYTYPYKEFVGESDVVCDIFVGDNPLVHGLPHRHQNRRFAHLLPGIGEEGHRVVSIAAEHRVTVLAGWVDEDLGFCLGEFAEPDHTLTG